MVGTSADRPAVLLRPGRSARRWAIWIVVLFVAAVVTAVLGSPAFLVMWCTTPLYMLVRSTRSHVSLHDRTVVVRNALTDHEIPRADIAELRIVATGGVRRGGRNDVVDWGLQSLGIQVVDRRGRATWAVASERFVWKPGMPPEYQQLADALGVPITVRGHPEGLWGVGGVGSVRPASDHSDHDTGDS